jgi:hypothetical protein
MSLPGLPMVRTRTRFAGREDEGIWQTLPGAGESEVLIPQMIEVELWNGRR